ncbi:MAG: pirin family protein [Steroidobacteraceae bacterium]
MTIEQIIGGRARDIGGFSVRRVLPAPGRRMVGPFIFFDHIGPETLAPGRGVDVRPHPHIALATVTYLYSGSFFHRDSLGSALEIHPGDVNWMTAGRGIAHSERTPAAARAQGSQIHGVQSWVALPDGHEEVAPAFAHHDAASLPHLVVDGCDLRVIAGEAFGRRSPVEVLWPTLYVDASMPAGAALELPADHTERAVYVAAGELEIDGQTLGEAQLALLTRGLTVRLRALHHSRVMLLGGEPFPTPRYIWWNFVASSRERIEQAKRDWAGGRFAPVPGESEFIPLPDD